MNNTASKLKQGIKIAYSDIYRYELPDKHRFPMQKYTLIPERLLAEGVVSEANFFAPTMLTEAEILTTHTSEYWHKLKTQTLTAKEARPIGFPMTVKLVERGRYIAHATYECAKFAIQSLANGQGVSLNVAGGTHHAFADHGEGFCVLNDVAIATNLLLARNEASQILIVDLDVHQGNGNASILANEPRAFVFSMHGEKNYPFRKVPSDLDIALPNDTDDSTYLSALQETLPKLIQDIQPDLIFYQAGVDGLATDKLGKLAMSLAGCQARDAFVFETAKANGIPVAVVMGGGYSEDVDTVVTAHCNTFIEAKRVLGN